MYIRDKGLILLLHKKKGGEGGIFEFFTLKFEGRLNRLRTGWGRTQPETFDPCIMLIPLEKNNATKIVLSVFCFPNL